MDAGLLLVILVSLSLWLTYLVWKKTKELSFVVGFFFIYFWTLHGAWLIIYENQRDILSAFYNYHYLEEKLFPIMIDGAYVRALVYYGLFLLVIQLTVLKLARNCTMTDLLVYNRPVVVSHWPIIGVSGFFATITALLLYEQILTSIGDGLSFYKYRSESGNEFGDLYKIANLLALFGASLGMVVSLCGNSGRLLTSSRSTKVSLSYVAILCALIIINIIIGRRNSLFVVFVSAFLFYTTNATRKHTVTRMALFLGFGIAIIAAINGIRSVSLDDYGAFSVAMWGQSIKSVIFSIEAFAAHFSMYGVIKHNVPLSPGISLIFFLASLPPSFLGFSRPVDTYTYYANEVLATPGQGYSIHHATGWYLNFGFFGVVLGALFLGTIWSYVHNQRFIQERKSIARKIAAAIMPYTFVGYLPAILRAGPEIYKGYFFEAVLGPLLIFLIAAYVMNRKRRQLRQKVFSQQQIAREFKVKGVA